MALVRTIHKLIYQPAYLKYPYFKENVLVINYKTFFTKSKIKSIFYLDFFNKIFEVKNEKELTYGQV